MHVPVENIVPVMKGRVLAPAVLCLIKNDPGIKDFQKQERLRGYFDEPLVGLLRLSYLSLLRSGVSIFVHPADSSAQPSAQAASLLIGPIWRN